MTIRAPQFVDDVVRDLRDRRLLIPAIALLVALVAVPMLLSRSEPAPPPPAPAAAVSLEGAATQPAVLAESVTVRDYKQRLDQLKSKNPFSEHFTAPKIGKGAGLQGIGGSPVGEIPAGTPSTSGLGTGITDTSSSGTTSSSTSTSTDTPGSGHSQKPDTVTRFLTHRIDVLVGPVGSVEQRNGVEQLKLLPSNSSPVLAFLGTSEDGKRAVFLVSDDVSVTSGGGGCFPSPSNCTYVTMREGDERTFDYTPDGLTYKLKLRQIRDVKLKDAPGVSVP